MVLAQVISPQAMIRDVLPVDPPLDELFPYGGPVRGSVVAVEGSTALLLALAAAASAQGSWSAVVGLPTLGLAAVAEAGVDLTRFAVVPTPGEQWSTAVAVLLDGFDLVIVRAPQRARAAEARRLAARVRDQRAVLLVTGSWPEPVDLRIRLAAGEWTGIEDGYGRLTGRRCTLTSSGRGAAAREQQVTAWLPPAR
jgi:hypothetical protein